MPKMGLEGAEELIEVFDAIKNTDELEAALKKACLIVERAAKEKAPKGTGELRNSIESTIERDESSIKGVVFSPLLYAPYIEYGTGLFAEKEGRKDVPWHYQDDEGNWHSTSGQPPRPYLRPALTENRERITRLLREGLIDD